jgi:transposase-like protein
MQKNFPSNRKLFGMNKEVLRQRQMNALQSRNDAGITDKVIARAIDCHPDTVGNWRRGITEMKIGDLIALDHFFSSMGDWQFVEQVCGELAVRRRHHAMQLKAKAERMLEQAQWIEDSEIAVA